MSQPASESVIVADYDPRWPALYEDERERIVAAIDEWLADIQHVGSTAVTGLAAKPIIDILVSVQDQKGMIQSITPLVQMGYECMGEYGIAGRIFFRKRTGMPEPGQVHGGVARTHHLHMFPVGHVDWERHLAFRDYLRSHPDTLLDYERLKRDLTSQFPTDMEAYTEAKTDFIRGIEKAALARSPYPHSRVGGDSTNER